MISGIWKNTLGTLGSDRSTIPFKPVLWGHDTYVFVAHSMSSHPQTQLKPVICFLILWDALFRMDPGFFKLFRYLKVLFCFYDLP